MKVGVMVFSFIRRLQSSHFINRTKEKKKSNKSKVVMQNDMREKTILICVKYQNERMKVCITLRQTQVP